MAGDKRILVVLILLVQLPCWAQVNRYVIFFKDKQGTPFTISDPAAFLSPQAIERRIKQGIVVTEQDLPVNPSYVQGVAGAGADVFFRTRWFNGVLVQCDAALVPSIQNLSFVDRVEFVAPGVKLSNGGRKKTSLRKKNGTVGIETKSQLEMIGVHEMHQANVIGQNITIAVFDAGFPGVDATAPFSEIFAENRFNAAASYDFVYNTTDVFQYDGHGTEVLSVIAAKIPDDYTGGAYEANFQLYVTEDASSEYRVEEYNWAFAAERADSAGADIINSSLGYYDFDDASMNYTTAQMDGQTAVVTKAAQWSAERGIVVVCSAGNEGNIPSWRIITAPADAVDVLAIGAVNENKIKSSASSTGPTADGRIKPDLAALGLGVRVIKQSGVMGFASGTSLSTPLITSLVAGVWQRYPDLTNKELIAVLKKTASQANNPDNLLGYGIPNFRAVVNYLEPIVQTSILEVFPNPVIDTVNIRPDNPDEISSARVEVISAQGQILIQQTINFSWYARTYQSSLASLATGTYFMRIWIGDRKFIFKIIKA